VWPLRQATKVVPVMAEDFVPNMLRNPRAMMRVANLARRADLRHELEQLRDQGLPITILWATRDGVIPRESFEALCVASGVEGTVIEGSHSWLLAEPDRFGEVITNDLRVAQAARELEQEHTPKSRRRGIRRMKTLADRQAPTPVDGEVAAVKPPGRRVAAGDRRSADHPDDG
jgi:hypothetical protein